VVIDALELTERFTRTGPDTSHWMTVFGAAGENTPLRIAAAGREYDELVRVNGRWLIKLRDVAPKDER
jgi:hypothetical protein